MKADHQICDAGCDGNDIAAYLDGELHPEDESRIEVHFSACRRCRDELELQKEILSAIDSAMESPGQGLEVPPNFARIVTVNAESSISGIRAPGERFKAAFIGAALLLLITASLSTHAGMSAYVAAEKTAVKIFAVIGIFVHSTLDLVIGIGVVLRCFGQGVFFSSVLSGAVTLTLFGLSLLMLSKLIVRDNRTS